MAMALAGSPDEQVRLYALARPVDIAQELKRIRQSVLQALGVSSPDEHHVAVSESSGWFTYAAKGQVWDRPIPPSLPDRAAALKAAEGFLLILEARCSQANKAWPKSLHGISLLPPVAILARAELSAIPRPDGSALDHWLYRAEPQLILDAGGKTRIGVLGATVEVRIGHRDA
jgi:hypothetical protein